MPSKPDARLSEGQTMAVDKPAGADTAHAPAQPGKVAAGRCFVAAGHARVVAVVWALLPTLKVNEAPAAPAAGGRAPAQWLADGGASGAGCGAGGVAGARVGLRAPAVSSWAGRPACRACAAGPTRARTLGGVAGAAWLWLLSRLAPAALQPSDPASAMPLVVKLLYGGITEELLMRWGVMTLLLWLGWRLLQRGRAARGLVAAAVLLSDCLLWASARCAGMAGVLTMPVVAFVLVGNTVFGLRGGLAVCAPRPGGRDHCPCPGALLASRCFEGRVRGFLVTGM